MPTIIITATGLLYFMLGLATAAALLHVVRPAIRRLFCRHESATFVRGIYGDEINLGGGKRSVWHCQSCGSVVLRDDLHPA